jgi:hypothetical protein
MKRTLIVLLLVLMGLTVRAETQVLISASKTVAFIGDRISLKVMARTDLEIDKIKILSPQQDFEILSRSSLPPQKQNDKTVFEENIDIAFFKTGEFDIGPLTVQLLKGEEVRKAKETNAVPIKIKSVLTDKDKDIKPLKSPIAIKGNPFYVLKYVLLAAAVILLIVFITLFIKARRRKAAAESEPQLSPLEELALKIKELADLKLLEKGKFKEFFLRLTEIIKHFLNRLYRFNAEDLTTLETMLYLEGHERDQSIFEGLAFLLNTADLVKFARYIPDSGVLDDVRQRIDRVIAAYRQRVAMEEQKTDAAPGL